jgi:hypothetical protein
MTDLTKVYTLTTRLLQPAWESKIIHAATNAKKATPALQIPSQEE